MRAEKRTRIFDRIKNDPVALRQRIAYLKTLVQQLNQTIEEGMEKTK